MSETPAFSTFEMKLETATAQAGQPPAVGAQFRMLILGDLTGRTNRGAIGSSGIANRKLIAIDRDNFDEVLERLAPTLQLRLGNDDAATTDITFRELDDFHPDRLFERVELFEQLRRMRRRLMNKDTFAAAAAELTTGRLKSVSAKEPERPPEPKGERPADLSTENLLDAALEATDTSSGGAGGANPFEHLIQGIVAPYIEPAADPRQPEFVAAVDNAIGEHMRRLLHYPEFQALESAWRGIYFLVRRLETDTRLKLQLLDVSVDELADDVANGRDLSQSTLWKVLSDASIGTPGNDPFACLVGLFELEPTAASLSTFAGLAAIAEQLGAPLLAGASGRFAGCESFADSPDPADWKATLDGDIATLWTEFRRQTFARNTSLLAPRFLIRLPYGRKTDAAESFEFEEMPEESRHSDYLWCHSSILAALLLGSEFTEQGWSLRSDASREFDGLPVHFFERDGDVEQMPCAEAWLTERSAGKLSENGLTTVFSIRKRDAVLLPGLKSAADQSGPLSGPWS